MAAAIFHPGKGGDVCRIRGRGFVAHSGQGLATAIMAQALWGMGRLGTGEGEVGVGLPRPWPKVDTGESMSAHMGPVVSSRVAADAADVAADVGSRVAE
jgi:hypothetical protein